jgi:hypothetical protein
MRWCGPPVREADGGGCRRQGRMRRFPIAISVRHTPRRHQGASPPPAALSRTATPSPWPALSGTRTPPAGTRTTAPARHRPRRPHQRGQRGDGARARACRPRVTGAGAGGVRSEEAESLELAAEHGVGRLTVGAAAHALAQQERGYRAAFCRSRRARSNRTGGRCHMAVARWRGGRDGWATMHGCRLPAHRQGGPASVRSWAPPHQSGAAGSGIAWLPSGQGNVSSVPVRRTSLAVCLLMLFLEKSSRLHCRDEIISGEPLREGHIRKLGAKLPQRMLAITLGIVDLDGDDPCLLRYIGDLAVASR